MKHWLWIIACAAWGSAQGQDSIQRWDSTYAAWIDAQANLSFYHVPEAPDSIFLLDATTDSVFIARLEALDALTPLDLRLTPSVKRVITYYLERRSTGLARAMGQSTYYYPIFEEALDRHGLPLELKHLPIIESALNPKATSRVGAKGLWQFMYATGKLQGLEISSYVDERSDPYASSDAAARYLKKLYGMYGNWELALAAYNAGPGNVNRAIRRSGGHRTYWMIQPYLPRETRNYIPSLIAVNYLMSYGHMHGITPQAPPVQFFDVDSIMPAKPVALADVASMLDLELTLVKQLNPQYKLDVIPGQREGHWYPLVLPREAMMAYLAAEDSIQTLTAARMKKARMPDPSEIRAAVTHHRVRRGETLGHLAAKYRVSVSSIQRENRLRGTMIREGQVLRIPSR